MSGEGTRFDAIAIGGGLAGAAFALELARNGLRVLVLERTREATLKVCGDFLSAEAIELLAYLGLDASALGASPVERLTLATGNRAAHAGLPFRAAGLSRLILDETLLGLAKQAGAAVERGAVVTRLAATPSGAEVEAGGKKRAVPAVCLASGKHNLRGWPRDPGGVTAFKVQLALTPAASADLRGRVQLVLFDGGYVGASLVERDVATVCWQLDASALARLGSDWRGQLDGISAGSDVLGDLVAGAKPVTARPAAIAGLPFGYIRRRAIGPAVYAAGDQLAVIPAFTGDGTSIALASGIRAARAVLAGESAAGFQAGFARSLRRQFGLAGAVSALFRARPMRHAAVGTMAMLPAVASVLAGATRLKALGEAVPSKV
jgi:flavin-dependent dehydrogenase